MGRSPSFCRFLKEGRREEGKEGRREGGKKGRRVNEGCCFYSCGGFSFFLVVSCDNSYLPTFASWLKFVLSVDYPVFFVLQFAAAKNVHLTVFVPCTEVRN